MQNDILPPYSPSRTFASTREPGVRASIRHLPLHLLHRILTLTLDPLATRSRFSSDPREEKVRRLWYLHKALRGVDRTFYLVATSILRTLFLSQYLQQVLPNLSSDPFPHTSIISPGADSHAESSKSVFASRGRETAVYDHFIALRVGEDLRRMESELSEEGQGERDIFTRLQPTARLEDLLLSLPTHLIASVGPRNPPASFPLPQSHLSVSLTPSWVQLFLHASPFGARGRNKKHGRIMVLEVHREGTLEATIRMLGEGLNEVRKGAAQWGDRVHDESYCLMEIAELDMDEAFVSTIPSPAMPGLTTAQVTELSAINVVIHPLVLLSVVDHASRVPLSKNKRVLGVLLGQDNGRIINVANSFAVPFEEDERDPKTFFLDLDFVEEMWRMFRKVNAKEIPIGFYHTGPRLRSSDLEITELFKRFTSRPVMVIVDVRAHGGRGDTGIPTDAYFAVEEIRDDGTATQRTFSHVPTSVEAEEAEEIGVEHLLRDISSSSSAPSSSLLTTQSLTTRVTSQLSALRGLHARLIEVGEYLTSVQNSKLPVNHQVIYHLQEIVGLLPQLGGDVDLGKAFRVGVNDSTMVVYLSALIRTVLALHDLIENRIVNAQQELEDAKSPEEKKTDVAAVAAGVKSGDVDKAKKESDENEKK
ncbi:MAG: proteasome regulatory particle subunit [Tremellales sp. Tagirdzhanova-0007]|nr:MAG: proteasome regulatory particle subunit [Tremellales sp. Tagirdzhanova-0007]